MVYTKCNPKFEAKFEGQPWMFTLKIRENFYGEQIRTYYVHPNFC